MENNVELVEKRYPYTEAHAIALAVLEELKPHCIRAEIAGSIRRKKESIGDIEIVAIPKLYVTGTGENGLALVVNKWEKVKGNMEYGKTKYTQRILPEGIKLDLFFADEANWGLIFAMRTGSADFSHKVLADGWCRRGFKSVGGYITRDGERIDVGEEIDLFRISGVLYKEPEDRNL